MKKLLFVLFIFLMICHCSNTTQPLSSQSGQVVIQAYLFAGKPVNDVKISSLIPWHSRTKRMPINDAKVFIEKNNLVFELMQSPGDSGYYQYNGSDLTVNAGDQFSLKVFYKNQTAFATTVVPSCPEIKNISRDTLIYPQYPNRPPEHDSQIKIEWDNEDEGDSLYYVVVRPKGHKELSIWNGYNPLPFGQESNYWLTGNEWTFYHYIIHFFNVKFAGEYVFYLYHINQEYADLYKVRDVFQEHQTEAPTNIQNGYGIFTAFNCDSIRFFVKFE